MINIKRTLDLISMDIICFWRLVQILMSYMEKLCIRKFLNSLNLNLVGLLLICQKRKMIGLFAFKECFNLVLLCQCFDCFQQLAVVQSHVQKSCELANFHCNNSNSNVRAPLFFSWNEDLNYQSHLAILLVTGRYPSSESTGSTRLQSSEVSKHQNVCNLKFCGWLIWNCKSNESDIKLN